jgi:hypothetical protein
MQKPRGKLGAFYCLLQEELTEQQHPDEIQETKDDTAAKGSDQAHHEAEKAALLGPGGPSDENFSYPVYKGDDEEQKLYETVLFVKPSHWKLPPM